VALGAIERQLPHELFDAGAGLEAPGERIGHRRDEQLAGMVEHDLDAVRPVWGHAHVRLGQCLLRACRNGMDFVSRHC